MDYPHKDNKPDMVCECACEMCEMCVLCVHALMLSSHEITAALFRSLCQKEKSVRSHRPPLVYWMNEA